MYVGFNFRTALTAFALLVLLAARSEAQAIAENFDQLRFRVQAGDTVYIVDGTGHEQEARILDVSSSLLAVSLDGTRRSLAERDVTRIRPASSGFAAEWGDHRRGNRVWSRYRPVRLPRQ